MNHPFSMGAIAEAEAAAKPRLPMALKAKATPKAKAESRWSQLKAERAEQLAKAKAEQQAMDRLGRDLARRDVRLDAWRLAVGDSVSFPVLNLSLYATPRASQLRHVTAPTAVIPRGGRRTTRHHGQRESARLARAGGSRPVGREVGARAPPSLMAARALLSKAASPRCVAPSLLGISRALAAVPSSKGGTRTAIAMKVRSGRTMPTIMTFF